MEYSKKFMPESNYDRAVSIKDEYDTNFLIQVKKVEKKIKKSETTYYNYTSFVRNYFLNELHEYQSRLLNELEKLVKKTMLENDIKIKFYHDLGFYIRNDEDERVDFLKYIKRNVEGDEEINHISKLYWLIYNDEKYIKEIVKLSELLKNKCLDKEDEKYDKEGYRIYRLIEKKSEK